MTLKDFLAGETRRIDAALDRLTPAESTPPETIHRAMRYSLFAGGKRIRPILCLQGAAAISNEAPGALDAGCALEMIHTYSLIHDDLPALDNDDFRRGKPTCHKVFGEAMAILAGDALFTLAMQTLVRIEGQAAAATVALVEELSVGGGTVEGMIGGQVTDIEGERQPPTPELARSAFIAPRPVRFCGPACAWAASARGGDRAQIEALSKYGEHVGLAFQIVDDILDVEESSEALGKTAGKDAAQGKITFPAVYGLEESRCMAQEECGRAHEALAPFGDARRAAARDRRSHCSPKIVKTRGARQRLDRMIVDRSLAESREKAQALIMAGEVLVDGQKASKAGQLVSAEARVEVTAKLRYVGRGGLKTRRRAAAFRHRRHRSCRAQTSAPPPADSRIACCRRAPRACTPSTWERASWTGGCATIRASWCMKASMPDILNSRIWVSRWIWRFATSALFPRR